MPIKPTLADLQRNVDTEIKSYFKDDLPRHSQARIALTIINYALVSLYEYLDKLFINSFATTADESALEHHAAVWGVPRLRNIVDKGSIIVEVDVEGAKTVTIDNASGIKFNSDRGGEFYVIEKKEISSGSGKILVEGRTKGEKGRLFKGDTLTLQTPIEGVKPTAKSDSDIAPFIDAEPVEAWRKRILQKIRTPARGGTLQEIIDAAIAFGNDQVGGAFIGEVAGESVPVNVYGVLPAKIPKNRGEAEKALIVNGDQLELIQEQLISDVCVVTVRPTVSMAKLKVLNFDILELSPNDSNLQTAIRQAIYDYISKNPKPAVKSVHLSKISEVISAVISEEGHTLKLTDNHGATKFDIGTNEIVYVTEESIKFG